MSDIIKTKKESMGDLAPLFNGVENTLRKHADEAEMEPLMDEWRAKTVKTFVYNLSVKFEELISALRGSDEHHWGLEEIAEKSAELEVLVMTVNCIADKGDEK